LKKEKYFLQDQKAPLYSQLCTAVQQCINQAMRLATLGVFKMATINAQTIINAVTVAAALAPAYHDSAVNDAMPSGAPHGYDGAAEYGELAAYENNPHGYCYDADKSRKQAIRTVDDMQDSARAELRAMFNVPLKIKIQTSERGFMRIVNTRARLEALAATVRSNAKAFGGGLVRAPKAKPAQSWNAGIVRTVRELIEDRDYAGAAELAERQCGAVFYLNDKGNHAKGHAFFMYAPMAVQGLPDSLVSGRCDNGKYSVFGLESGLSVDGQQTTRKAAEQRAIAKVQYVGLEKLEQAIQKGGVTDHAAARAEWFIEHGIQDAQEIAARIEDSEAADDTATNGPDLAMLEAMAAQDVAQVVASATAGAAIEQAQEAAALQEVAQVVASMKPARAPVILLNGTVIFHKRMPNGSQDAYIESGRAMTGAECFDYEQQVKAMAECEAIEQAQPVRELETVCEASSAANGAGMQQGQASTSAAPGAVNASRTGQTVQGKSGHWIAFMFRNAAGLPSLEFTGPDGAREPVQSFEDGRARMAALQKMARRADDIAAGFEDDNTESAATPINIGAALLENVDVSTLGSATVQRWAPELYAGAVAYLEDINYHSEVLLIRALRTDNGAAIGYARRLLSVQAAAGHLIPEAAAMAGELHAALDTLAKEPGSTDTRKTLENEGAQLHGTPQDLGKNPAPGPLTITITRAEGLSIECGKPVTVASFADADKTLNAWSDTVRPGGCSDKVDFSITWPNGETYEGTYSLKHHSSEAPSLARHLIDFAEFETGLFCPAHMTQKSYGAYLKTVTPERRAFFGGVLEILRGLGVYFPRMRPTALDLRALLQAGATPAQLVGIGVDYTPHHYSSESGTGAIVSATPSDWCGMRVVVNLEDGRTLNAEAAEFADDGSFRFNMKSHGAPYLAQLAAAVATVKASESAAKEQAEHAHAVELQRLAAEYPQLKRAESKHSGGKHAAINARILLKAAFKGIKFSVTSSYNSMRVNWIDGPTVAQVNDVIGRFDIGASDSQTDYFYTVRTAFSELFGGVQYMNVGRDETDGMILRALAHCFPQDESRPSVEDYRRALGLLDWCGAMRREVQEHIAAMDARNI
jgi:hypothetical protein